jgi:hypothetical protein
MYADYPISRELLDWESPSSTTQASETGQLEGRTAPFTFLGPASLVSFQQERPIQMVWRLNHLMPAIIFEENRRGG